MYHTSQKQTEVRKSILWIYYVFFFSLLNESVFNVSIPNIAKQFTLNPSEVSWVVTVFFIALGVGMVVYGKLSDIFSIRTLMTIGIVLYSAGSIIGFAFQAWYPAVIAARTIQGSGCAAIPSLVFVIVARYFSAVERGKIFGIITSTGSFAIGIGPVLGGFITHSFQWAYLFFLPLPIAAAIPFFLKYFPKEGRKAGSLDILGGVLLSITVSALILFTTEGDWFYLAGAIVGLYLFIVQIRRAMEPFVDPSLFANSRYRSGLVIGFFIFGSVLSVLFVIPIMLNKTYGFDANVIGFVLFPGAFSAVIFGKVAGNLTVKKGSNFVNYLGLGLLSFSFVALSCVIGLWVGYMGAALILMYIGFSFVQTALAESVTKILPVHQIGVGMGFFNMTSTISGAIITALVAKTLEEKLLAFRLHPFITDSNAYMYGNLILIFSIIIATSVLLYFNTFGRKSFLITVNKGE